MLSKDSDLLSGSSQITVKLGHEKGDVMPVTMPQCDLLESPFKTSHEIRKLDYQWLKQGHQAEHRKSSGLLE
jgi:hypothetical protein